VQKHIDLLLITEGLKSHFVWISHISRLVARRTKSKQSTFVCNHCSHPFTNEKAFDRHFPDCSIHTRQMINSRKMIITSCFGLLDLKPFII